MKVPKLEYKNPYEVFVLFAALNVLGYNDENHSGGMSLLRTGTRKSLRGYAWGRRYPELNGFLRAHHPWFLLDFVFRGRSIPNLQNFSEEPAVRVSWNKIRPRQEAGTRKAFILFRRETLRLLQFIGKPIRTIDRIILILNPLDAYWRGYSFHIGQTGYVVVGPGAEKNNGELIRHELLHFLAPHFRISIPSHSPRIHARLAHQGYNDQSIISREYVIRGLNLIYQSKFFGKDIHVIIKQEQKDFPHIEKVVELLKIKMGLSF